jgi:hypothetical protein
MKPEEYTTFDYDIVEAVKSGATRFHQIDARLSRSREFHWRLLDRRLQSLRKAGRLDFNQKTGWSVRNGEASPGR